MQFALSFEQAPPISVPFRFFLTAPLFGATAGLMLAWVGPPAIESRWTPFMTAATHLITAGFMLQVMCGALLQFVAVVAGANIWRPRLVAALVHPLTTVGALLLAIAFLFSWQRGFMAAALMFVLAMTLFLAVMALALFRTPAQGASILVLRLAVIGLLITILFGVGLSIALGGYGNLLSKWPLTAVVNVHAAWGLGGWALMLIIGVSFLVVPMFLLTPPYPPQLTRLLPAGIFLTLCLWSFLLLSGAGERRAWNAGLITAGMLLAAAYAAATLWLQARRRRRRTDTTFVFWRGAMLLLIVLGVSWISFTLLPNMGGHPRAPLWLGTLAMPGVFLPVIMGMLYKIMPFLNWLHLQQRVGTGVDLPNMKQMIPPRSMRLQMILHFSAVTLLLAAAILPRLARPAGLVFCASCLLLEWNLVGAAILYWRLNKRVRTTASAGSD